MRIKEIGEFGLIERLSAGCIFRSDRVIKGIGDDAAAFSLPGEEVVLITTDMLVERVHFIKDASSGFNLGYKALAVNLSDIAAMGAAAREAFISIAIPENCQIGFIEDFYDGMKYLASQFDVNILGGDTTGSRKDLVINVVVVGSAPEKQILFRHGAQSGDKIFSTGTLGDSRAGCHLIINDIPAKSDHHEELQNAHLLPFPCLREGRFLASLPGVHAAIDVSDGLSSDLAHILEQSRKGAKIYSQKIPVSENLKKFCLEFNYDPVRYAVNGGEDYTLLFTAAPDRAQKIADQYKDRFGQEPFEIGEITDSGLMELIWDEGAVEKISPSGWDHFPKQPL